MPLARPILRTSAPVALVLASAALCPWSPATAVGETCVDTPATIVGSGVVTGTAGDDVIVAGPGADVVDGGGGNDLICSGAGNDRVLGGPGDDTVSDGPGADLVDLGADHDTFLAWKTKDARDVVDGGAGFDYFFYGLRTAALKINLSNATADDGELGEADKLLGVESLVTGDGNDTLVGGPADEFLFAAGGNDKITPGPGSDIVQGAAGNDVVVEDPTALSDSLYGGSGTDEISYAARTAGVTIDLSLASYSGEVGAGEGDVLAAFEVARGGAGDDILVGSSAPDKLLGGDGADEIADGLGADVVDGGGGCDEIRAAATGDPGDVLGGGPGSCDLVSYAARTEPLAIRLNTTAAVNGAAGEGDSVRTMENATGGAGDDVITGSGAANVLRGGAGDDVLGGLGGNDVLDTVDHVASNDRGDGGFGTDTAYGDPLDQFTKVEKIF